MLRRRRAPQDEKAEDPETREGVSTATATATARTLPVNSCTSLSPAEVVNRAKTKYRTHVADDCAFFQNRARSRCLLLWGVGLHELCSFSLFGLFLYVLCLFSGRMKRTAVFLAPV